MNQDIPCKTINTSNFPNSLEVLPLKINLRNKKFLLLAGKNLLHLMINIFLYQLPDPFGFYKTTYDYFFR